MPLVEHFINEDQDTLGTNVWVVVSTTKACLSLPLQAKHVALVVNPTSIPSVCPNPMAGALEHEQGRSGSGNADGHFGFEPAPFNIGVIDSKTETANLIKSVHICHGTQAS